MKPFLQKNKISLLIFTAGLIFQSIYLFNYIKTDWAITPIFTYINLTSLLLISLALFLLSVKNKRYIISNLFLLTFLILVVELVCFVILDSPDKYKKDFGVPYLPADHVASNIGTVPYSDSTYHSVLIKENDTVYDINFTIDSNWKRVTPNFDSSRSKYALFFGCSIAFGEGLKDDQTFPYHFQQITNEYNSYNFAYPGYGANHMLARMEFQDLTKQVREKDGAAFYLFFDDHINRSIGSMNTFVGWLSNAPYYSIEDGKLVRNKMFKNGRYWISKFYELVHQTSIVNYFKLNFPLKLKPKHFELTAEIIKESKDKYKQQFGNDNFYVILYPSYDFLSMEDYNYFLSILDEKNIKYIDLHTFIKYSPEHTLGGDPHPNGNTNKILVEELINRLK